MRFTKMAPWVFGVVCCLSVATTETKAGDFVGEPQLQASRWRAQWG